MPFSEHTFTDTELVAAARKGLYERSRLQSPDATLAAIEDLKVWIGEELAYEEAASASFGRVLSELWHAEYLDQLPPLLNKFERLTSAYFVRRGSVTAFHGFCNAWREGLLRRTLLFAEEGLEVNDHGHPPAPYALLAAGSLGRHEQTLEESDPYFLVWTKGEGRYFEQFTYRILAILDQLGVISKESATIPRVIWRGSIAEWQRYAEDEGGGAQEQGRLEQLAELRYISGDEKIAGQAVEIARSSLAALGGSSRMSALANQALAVPVALGIFGGIRVESEGPHRGSFNLAVSGLNPLVNGVRVLAMQHDLEPGPTLARLEALASMGILEKELVVRLQAAYHHLAGLKIGKEIALEQPYLEPASLSVVEQQKLRGSLEAVRQLQRVIKHKDQAKAWGVAKEPKEPAVYCEAIPDSPG